MYAKQGESFQNFLFVSHIFKHDLFHVETEPETEYDMT